jgi:hypothetical protein
MPGLSPCGMTARRVLPILAMIATAQAFAPNSASAHRAASTRFAVSTTRMSATRPRGEQCSSHPGDGAVGMPLDGTACPLSPTALAEQAFFSSRCPPLLSLLQLLRAAAWLSRPSPRRSPSSAPISSLPLQPRAWQGERESSRGSTSRSSSASRGPDSRTRTYSIPGIPTRSVQELPESRTEKERVSERERERKAEEETGKQGGRKGPSASSREVCSTAEIQLESCMPVSSGRRREGGAPLLLSPLSPLSLSPSLPPFPPSLSIARMKRAVRMKLKNGGEAATKSRAFPPLVHTTGRSAHPPERSAIFASRLAGELRRRAED